jgi:hypothetical protein
VDSLAGLIKLIRPLNAGLMMNCRISMKVELWREIDDPKPAITVVMPDED